MSGLRRTACASSSASPLGRAAWSSSDASPFGRAALASSGASPSIVPMRCNSDAAASAQATRTRSLARQAAQMALQLLVIKRLLCGRQPEGRRPVGTQEATRRNALSQELRKPFVDPMLFRKARRQQPSNKQLARAATRTRNSFPPPCVLANARRSQVEFNLMIVRLFRVARVDEARWARLVVGVEDAGQACEAVGPARPIRHAGRAQQRQPRHAK